MTEAERRRYYGWHRVLIEYQRLRYSHFADAVLYFTGVQVELLRNLMQYARQRDGYVSIYGPDSYLVPTDAEWDEIQAIVADMEETLMGNPNTLWGYTDRWFENLDYVAVTTYILQRSVAVPAGYVYVLEAASMLLQDRATTTANIGAIPAGAPGSSLQAAATLEANTWLFWTGHATFKAGDQVQLYLNGCQADDIFLGRLWGHKMVVP